MSSHSTRNFKDMLEKAAKYEKVYTILYCICINSIIIQSAMTEAYLPCLAVASGTGAESRGTGDRRQLSC